MVLHQTKAEGVLNIIIMLLGPYILLENTGEFLLVSASSSFCYFLDEKSMWVHESYNLFEHPLVTWTFQSVMFYLLNLHYPKHI